MKLKLFSTKYGTFGLIKSKYLRTIFQKSNVSKDRKYNDIYKTNGFVNIQNVSTKQNAHSALNLKPFESKYSMHVMCIKVPATSQFCQFFKNILCHNFLLVRVMSVKVYIFGKEIMRRIYVWPRIFP